jgi:hypothetical protein
MRGPSSRTPNVPTLSPHQSSNVRNVKPANASAINKMRAQQDQLDPLDSQDLMVHQEKVVPQVLTVSVETCQPLCSHVTDAACAQEATQDLQVDQETVDQEDLQEDPETVVAQDQAAIRDVMDSQEHPAHLDHQETQESQEVQETMEHVESREPQDQKDKTGQPDQTEAADSQDHQEAMDNRDVVARVESQDHSGSLDSQDPEGHQEPPARPDRTRFTAHVNREPTHYSQISQYNCSQSSSSW